jgi:tRNA modification GTPase
MDLAQAEGVAEVISAESEAAHKLAIHQMRGGFSAEINRLRQELLDFTSLIELELDFSEEDVEFADRSQLKNLLDKIEHLILELMNSFSMGNAIKKGIPVAIVGKPNVGKSTLLNELLNEERAIVSDIPGTTRDSIEDEITIEGIQFRFIDTAGIRETSDTIEALGIARTHEKIANAQIIIHLFDLTQTSFSQAIAENDELKKDAGDDKLFLLVGNKSDVVQTNTEQKDILFISARNKKNIDAIKSALTSFVKSKMNTQSNYLVSNVRHYEALKKAFASIESVKQGFHQNLPTDLIAIDIRKALHHLGEITGVVSTEDILGNIFGKFCIGK